MGVDLGVYRVRIGLFNSLKVKHMSVRLGVCGNGILCFLILSIIYILLLLSGDVEINPGPFISLWHCNVRGLNFDTHTALLADVAQKFDLLLAHNQTRSFG